MSPRTLARRIDRDEPVSLDLQHAGAVVRALHRRRSRWHAFARGVAWSVGIAGGFALAVFALAMAWRALRGGA